MLVILIFERTFNLIPGLFIGNTCFEMETNVDDTVTVTSTQSDEVLRKLGLHGKRNVRKITTLTQLLKDICISREKCIEWLKNKGLIPRVLFCPKCNNRMKFEGNNQAIDGYVWICKECADNPPQISARHGSWLENRDYPLPLLLLYTYLWTHGFTLQQICKETNLPLTNVEEWNIDYCTICHFLYLKNSHGKHDVTDGNNDDIDKESSAEIWKKENQSKDAFLQFLKQADSL